MDFLTDFLSRLEKKYPGEKEYHQSVREVFSSILPAIKEDPSTVKEYKILDRLAESEKTLIFKVEWKDTKGKVHVNKGYRVQHSSLLGPYKGGLRFSKDLTLSEVKFLAFEQTFKNSLTALPLGGAKGGADLDPKGLSADDKEAFCKAYARALSPHIGHDLDVAAGDIGVGEREIGFFVGELKKLKERYNPGDLTGKPIHLEGCALRDEATGFGAVYFLKNLLEDLKINIEDLSFCLSGFGSVARGAAIKITELGGKVLTLSGRDGFMLFKNGLPVEGAKKMKAARNEGLSKKHFAEEFGGRFFEGISPFGCVAADVYMPCATQNEIGETEAEGGVKLGLRFLVEGANMPTTPAGLRVFKKSGVCVLPSKAANAGGVATSYLEMMQNKQGESFPPAFVDEKIKYVMQKIYQNANEAAERFNLKGDIFAGANLYAFERLKKAILSLGT